jgi:glycosyltransferase involved in cell wall biosynthesis
MISIIIPSKNEPYLQQTIADIYKHAEGEIEILVGHDEEDQIGQRAQMNRLAVKARGQFIMKTDAHCSFGQGFDRIMLEDYEPDMIMAPYLLALNAEKWIVRSDKRHAGYVFDTQLVMQHAETTDQPLQETMCLQGSCFLTSTDNYWKWNLCDPSLGSWGGQGVELGIKAFLNGGRCVTTKKTYYGHLFRTNEEDFPYKRKQAEIDAGHQAVLRKFKTKAIASLIQKYNYPCDWTQEEVDKLV